MWLIVRGVPGLTSLWGFAALIRVAGRTILFDSGSNGRVLLKNMDTLSLAPESVDLVFLSHPHWDHMGGLDSLLELNPAATVVLHEGFSKHLIHDLRGLCGELIVVGADPLVLAPGVWSTGTFDSQPPEQALVIDTGGVTAAISGCAHPGMERIIEHAAVFLGKPIDWAIGGFHLMYTDAAGIELSIRALRDLGIAYLVPTHCTGDAAKEALQLAFGDRCIEGGVGREVSIVPRDGQSSEV
jgi:7,8-dihydropterin-6-yl-methyl-4-(beta-D-ribofuranosyl)aminobenzene 5'-phosphate synthase